VLQELEAAILRQDPSLTSPSGTESGIAARHPRRTPDVGHPHRRPDVGPEPSSEEVTRPPVRCGGGPPVPTTSLVGRGHELGVVQALLARQDVRLVTLWGGEDPTGGRGGNECVSYADRSTMKAILQFTL
jgi:hypothetical protein